MALFMGFGESSLDFELRFWTKEFEDHLRVRSEVGGQIDEAFREAGIKIPFPQRDVYVYPQASSSLEIPAAEKPGAESG